MSFSSWLRSRKHGLVRKSPHNSRLRTKKKGRSATRLLLELLEDRTVPSTIQGTVFNDANLSHNPTGQQGLQGWTVFLDVNQNAIIDPGETTTTTDGAGNYFFDTTNATPAYVAYGDVFDHVALKLEVGTGGRYLNTTLRATDVDRTADPNAVGVNF